MICNMCMNYPTIHFVNDAIFSSRAERFLNQVIKTLQQLLNHELDQFDTCIEI